MLLSGRTVSASRVVIACKFWLALMEFVASYTWLIGRFWSIFYLVSQISILNASETSIQYGESLILCRKRLVFGHTWCFNFFSKKFERRKKTPTCSSVTRLSIVPLFFVLFEKVKTGGVSGDFCFWVLAKTHTEKISFYQVFLEN